MKGWRESLLVLLAMTGVALAAPPQVIIQDAWFRALPAGLPAGGYFTVRNQGNTDLAIIGAASTACGMLMLHQSTNKGGMSGMGVVDRVALPAGASVAFSPGGFHLMCDRPKMDVGGQVPVVLKLSNGTALAVNFTVRDAKGR